MPQILGYIKIIYLFICVLIIEVHLSFCNVDLIKVQKKFFVFLTYSDYAGLVHYTTERPHLLLKKKWFLVYMFHHVISNFSLMEWESERVIQPVHSNVPMKIVREHGPQHLSGFPLRRWFHSFLRSLSPVSGWLTPPRQICMSYLTRQGRPTRNERISLSLQYSMLAALVPYPLSLTTPLWLDHFTALPLYL